MATGMDERTLVVLLHGLGATGAVWHGVGAALEAQGYRTLVPDLAGHGTTPGSAPYTLAQLAERVSALPNATASWYLCGHSLGGYVALEVAARAPWGAPRAAISLGAKLAFSDEERAQMALLAKRPARTFPTRAQALDRYRRVAGLAPD